ncbi:uncharacterized protein LOC129594597 [Paramacrobiotus metropolitanus]|uniref:uncharacterized protein LOC129594597 n=1 Tax=Paramacrobiotus metropolitanus TaxID=2943436 RepID=UPI0024456A39|nr:uncharacterized protein LOC129594597 [Paramacrobiotus metropolitanus]
MIYRRFNCKQEKMLLTVVTFGLIAITQQGHCQTTEYGLAYVWEHSDRRPDYDYRVTTALPGMYRHSNGEQYCNFLVDDPEYQRVIVVGECLKTEFGEQLLLVRRPQKGCIQKVSFGTAPAMADRKWEPVFAGIWYNLHAVDPEVFDAAVTSVHDCLGNGTECKICVQQTRLSDLIGESYGVGKTDPTVATTDSTTTWWVRDCRSLGGNAVCNVSAGTYCDCCFGWEDEQECEHIQRNPGEPSMFMGWV